MHGEGNLLLSFELLHLLQWLIDHEGEALKKLVEKAVKAGYKTPGYPSNDFVELQVSDPNIQQSIVEFLSLMDSLLLEAHHEQTVQKTLDHLAVPALNHIDSKICNEEVVQMSLEKASSRMKCHPEQNHQEVVLKELLKRWKPAKKSMN